MWHRFSPFLQEYRCQLVTTITCFIWHKGIIKVSTTILQVVAGEGGMDLIDVGVKCTSLLLLGCNEERDLSSSLTAKWFHVRGDFPPMAKPLLYTYKPEDFGKSEDLLSGLGVYYSATNGGIEENLQKASECHVVGPRGQEASVSDWGSSTYFRRSTGTYSGGKWCSTLYVVHGDPRPGSHEWETAHHSSQDFWRFFKVWRNGHTDAPHYGVCS